MQPHPSIYEIPLQNSVANNRWDQVPWDHQNFEHQGWGQLAKGLSHNCHNHSSESQTESSHSDGLHHKQPAFDSNPKATHFYVTNVVSTTNNVVIPPIVNCQVVHAIDSPTSNHHQKINLEHPDLDRASIEKNMKG